MLGISSNIINVMSSSLHNRVFNNIYDSGVGIWDLNSSRLRLRRADDDFEKEFNPVGNRLDVNGITNFHSWNLLDGSEYKDYLYDVPLGVDSDGNGVSDGWATVTGNVSIVRGVSNGYQTLEIKSDDNGNAGIRKISIPASAGDIFSLKCTGRVNGAGIRGRIRLIFRDSSQVVLSVNDKTFTNTTDEDITNINITAPATTDSVQFYCTAEGINLGDTGTAYFKNAVLVKNSFIEDIGLLTQDDDSDGVANGWKKVTNSNATVTTTIEDGFQKINLSNVTGEVNFAGISTDYLSAQASEEYKLYLTYKSSDIVGTPDIYFSVICYDSSKSLLSTAFIDDTVEFSDTETDYISTGFTTVINTAYVKLFLYLRDDVYLADSPSGNLFLKDVKLKQTNNSVYCTKIFDKSGNGNHAIQTTASEQPRLVNAGVFETNSAGKYSLYYDGTDDHFDVTDNAGLDITSGGLSILAEHDPDGVANNSHYIISRNLDSFATIQYGMIFSPLSIILQGAIRSDDNNILSTSKVSTVTYDFTNSKVYLDGLLKDTDVTTTTLTSRPNIQIGCRSNSADGLTKIFFYKGHITNIAVFNKALTQPQVTLLYNRLNAIGGA